MYVTLTARPGLEISVGPFNADLMIALNWSVMSEDQRFAHESVNIILAPSQARELDAKLQAALPIDTPGHACELCSEPPPQPVAQTAEEP